MKLNSIFSLFFLTFFQFIVEGQQLVDSIYIFPMNLKGDVLLAGNMGEIRKDHFHGGIDIKTHGNIGYPVVSSKGGYISRIRVSVTGYGKALYMFDENQFTTVYAHLYEFVSVLEDYIRKLQYDTKSYEIDTSPNKHFFNFKQGDTIAYSGNTGGSSGPHLHFEMRDNEQNPIDPLVYQIKNIKDTLPPRIKKIGFRVLNISSYIDGEQGLSGPYIIQKKKNGNKYFLNKKIYAIGQIGITLLADDYHNKSRNSLGVKKIRIFDNDSLLLNQSIDRFSFNNTRSIIRFYDYEHYIKSNEKMYSLYEREGNKLGFYKYIRNKGILNIQENTHHKIRIVCTDSYNNSSEVIINIFGKLNGIKSGKKKNSPLKSKIYILDNHFVYNTQKPNKEPVFYINGDSTAYNSNTINQMSYYFLPWNQQYNSFADSVVIDKGIIHLPKYSLLEPKKRFYDDNIDIKDGKKSIRYEIKAEKNATKYKIYFQHRYDRKLDAVIIEPKELMFKRPISIYFRPQKMKNIDKNKASIFNLKNNEYDYIDSRWNDDLIYFETKKGGIFLLREDNTPPKIVPIFVTRKKLKFSIKDAGSDIKSYICTIDDKWLLMEYDQKNATLFSNKNDHHFPLKGKKLKLVVTDNLNNKKSFIKNFK